MREKSALLFALGICFAFVFSAAQAQATIPTVTIEYPPDGAVFTTPVIDVNGTAYGVSDLDKVEVRVDSGPWKLASGTENWNTTVELSPGTNIIKAKATDIYGHSGTDYVTVTLNVSNISDTTPPNITISYPADGQSFNVSGITVNGTASDNVAVAKVEVKVNNGQFLLATGTTSWTRGVTLSPGTNTITARATDTSGNTKDATISVMSSVPQAPLLFVNVTPSNISVVEGQTFTLAIMANPFGASISSLQLNLGFDQNILRVNSVTEGNLFSGSGMNTSFSGGTIDNNAGTVANISNSISGNITSPGTFAIVNFTAILQGVSDIVLSSVQAGGNITINAANGRVNVFPPGFLHDVSISNMAATPSSPAAGDAVLISAQLANKLPQPEQNVPVIFFVDGTQAATKQFNLSSLETRAVNFSWTAVAGDHTLTLTANVTGDIFPQDNTASLLIHVSTPGGGGGGGGGGPSGGGGGGGGGGGPPPVPDNRGSNFTNVTIPNEINLGDELPASGCVTNLGTNSTVRINVDGTITDADNVTFAKLCFNLSGGFPPRGDHIVSLTLNNSGPTIVRTVKVVPPPISQQVKIIGISAPNVVYTGTNVSILVFVNAPGETVGLSLFSDTQQIGEVKSVVTGQRNFQFFTVFNSTGVKTLKAVAVAPSGTDSATRQVEVKAPPTTPTGAVLSGKASSLIAALLILLAILIAYYLSQRSASKKKEEKEEEKEEDFGI